MDNTWQDFYLSEWMNEPSHDWARDRYNRWSSTTYNNVLYPQRNSKALGFQLTIVDQYWYNNRRPVLVQLHRQLGHQPALHESCRE